MDIDKPVTARQLAWILWGPAVAIGLVALMIWIAAVNQANRPPSAAETGASLKANTERLQRHMGDLTMDQMNALEPMDLEASANSNTPPLP